MLSRQEKKRFPQAERAQAQTADGRKERLRRSFATGNDMSAWTTIKEES